MAGLFDKIKKDVQKGIKEGIAVVKEGANVVSEKMGELTAEGKSSILKNQETRRAIKQARRGERDKSCCPQKAGSESKNTRKNRTDGNDGRQKGPG